MKHTALALLFSLPLSASGGFFEALPNSGESSFVARGHHFRTWFGESEIRFEHAGQSVALALPGAAHVKPKAERKSAAPVHYLLGNDPAQWRYGQAQFERLRYASVYPGIDLVFYFQPQLEFDSEVRPGADPSQIALRFTGAQAVTLRGGDLVLATNGGEFRHHAPTVSQGGRLLPSRFRLDAQGLVRFTVDGARPDRALTIDPRVTYASYLGGTLLDEGFSTATDAAGNSYVCGWTDSVDFPIPAGSPPSRYGANRDAYLSKFSPAGTLLFSSYIGGNRGDACSGVTLDAQGNIYVVGNSFSTNFPRTAGTEELGTLRAWMMKLTPEGRMVYSFVLGSSVVATATRVGIFTPVVDATGALHAAGGTSGFTGVNSSLRSSFGGGILDAYYLRLNPAGDALGYFTYLGGVAEDTVNAMALDRDGTVYLAGRTLSGNFPAPPDVTLTVPAAGTAYAAKIDPRRNELRWVRTFGASSSNAHAMALAGQSLWLAGVAGSGLPVTSNAFQTTFGGGGRDGFVARLDTAEGDLQLASYHGGNNDDILNTITVDAAGALTAAGQTSSENLFTSADAVQKTYGGGTSDGMVLRLSPAGERQFATFLGGTAQDAIYFVMPETNGHLLFVGTTASADLPLSGATAQNKFGGGTSDAAVWRLDPSATSTGTAPSFTAAGVLNAASFAGGGVAPGQIVTLFVNAAGPRELVTAQLTADRRVASLVAETRVLFDGVAAPIVYTVAGQVSCVVPYAVAGRAATLVEVEYQGRKSAAVSVPVVASAPGIFTTQSGTGPAAALNGSTCCNAPSSPAAPGSIVTIFLTGEGQTTPAGVDGRLAEFARLEDFPRPVLPVTVSVGGRPASIAYAGAAPGLLAGLMQINFTIPPDAPDGELPLVVQIGDRSSRTGVTISVRR